MMRASLALLLLVAISGCFAAPAELQKLEALKEKLRSLHDVLDELNKNIDSLEAEQKEREFAPEFEAAPVNPDDKEFSDYLSQLSPEDREAVEKMKSKLKFLQATVHEEPGVDVPAEDGYSEEQPAEEAPEEASEDKREMAADLKNLMDNLPAEDQELLKEHPSMWGHLSKALRTPGGNPADVVANAAAPDEKRGYENELVSQLSDEDRQLLQKMRSKLGSLKTALRAETSLSDKSKGEFGEFVSSNGGVSSFEVRDAASSDGVWHNEETQCEGIDCNKPINAAEEVERRLLNDVRYAKQNGVSLKQVLRALMAARENA